MNSEVVQVLATIKDSIDTLAQPGCIDILSIIISFLSAIISGIAIVFAVRVPKQIAIRQEELQKRQIKVETYAYKLEYVKILYDLKQNMGLLQVIFSIKNLSNDSFSKLYYRYSTLSISYSDIIVNLEQAKNIFTSDSTKFLDDIKRYFTTVNELFSKFKIYGDVLTNDEQKEREKEKVTDLKELKLAVSCILYDLETVIPIINDDIRISDIHIMK